MLFIASRKKPEEYAKFRVAIKKRLYRKYQDWLEGFEGDAKKDELQDIYEEEVESLYSKIAEKLPQFKL